MANQVLAQTTPTPVECLIEPELQLELRFTSAGMIEKVFVKRGEAVKQDQVIAQLESANAQAAVDLARFKSQQMGPIQLAKAKVDASAIKFERRDAMAKDKLIAQQERDDALAELNQAKAELVNATENQLAAAIELRQQLSLLQARTLRSPITGVVSEQLAYAGEVVEPNDPKKPIVRLAQMDPLRAQLIVPLQRLGQFRLGQMLSLTTENGKRASARVTMVDRSVNAASGLYSVYATIANPGAGLTAGVRCDVQGFR